MIRTIKLEKDNQHYEEQHQTLKAQVDQTHVLKLLALIDQTSKLILENITIIEAIDPIIESQSKFDYTISKCFQNLEGTRHSS